MKRIYLAITITLCMCVGAVAQNRHESRFMRFYVPDCTGSPFPVSIDTYFIISESGQTQIKMRANFAYNAAEFSYFQKYSIPAGNNVYFKLDSGDIITLTCSSDEKVADGFVTSKNGTYQKYADYSYFPINDAIINSLKKHDIIKVRGQFKFEILDGSMQFTPNSDMPKTKDSFKQAETLVRKQYKSTIMENDRQEILKQNPLSGF